jgi:hypothetical protein
MKFIDYHESYWDDNKEFLRGDMWQFDFMNPPKIVYYPGDDLIHKRLNSVNLSMDTSVNGFEKRMRGNYVIRQQTGQSTNGQLTLSFIDKEDQAISYFVDDWKQKIADRDTKYSFRKEDVVCDCEMFITNSSRIDVRHLTFYNCIIMDAPLDENGADADGTDRSDVQLSMAFEHMEREFVNL